MSTLSNYQTAVSKKINRIFSEELKRGIVRDLDNHITNVSEVSRRYKVSRTSIYRWIYKYSPYSKRGEKVVVEKKSEQRKTEELNNRIKELERIIGQKQLEIDFKNKMIEIAEQEYKVDIKKKLGGNLLSGTGLTDQNTGTK